MIVRNHMPESFTPAARAIIAKKVLAHVASLDPDGGPNVSPVWVELDGDDLVINTALGRAKARNFASDERVAVSMIDPDNDRTDHHVARHRRGLHDHRRRRGHRPTREEVPRCGDLSLSSRRRGPRHRAYPARPHLEPARVGTTGRPRGRSCRWSLMTPRAVRRRHVATARRPNPTPQSDVAARGGCRRRPVSRHRW